MQTQYEQSHKSYKSDCMEEKVWEGFWAFHKDITYILMNHYTVFYDW